MVAEPSSNRGDAAGAEDASCLDSLPTFLAWVATLWSTEVPVHPDSRLKDVAPDDWALFEFVAHIELVVGEEFPEDLIDVLETLEDWFHFACVKREHRGA